MNFLIYIQDHIGSNRNQVSKEDSDRTANIDVVNLKQTLNYTNITNNNSVYLLSWWRTILRKFCDATRRQARSLFSLLLFLSFPKIHSFIFLESLYQLLSNSHKFVLGHHNINLLREKDAGTDP